MPVSDFPAFPLDLGEKLRYHPVTQFAKVEQYANKGAELVVTILTEKGLWRLALLMLK